MVVFNRSVFAALVAICAAGSVGQVVLTPQRPDGLYAPGDTAAWTVTPARGAATTQASYVVLKNGRRPAVKEGMLDLTNGSAAIEYPLGEPGQITIEVTPRPANTTTAPSTARFPGDRNGMPRRSNTPTRDGAIFGVEQLRPALPRPDDFDAFWTAKLAELNAVPANPQLDALDVNVPGVDYHRVTLDNIRGTHVRGQIAKPSRDGKFPAVLQLQYAGVYPLQRQWVTDRAKTGWIAMNLLAHDMPIDDADAIKRLAESELKNYQAIGNTDREQSYFLRMYLGDCQALKYLTSRPDWDDKTLVVVGDSMGGQQSFATVGLVGEALHVTAMIVHVPAGGDVGARSVGRSIAYPNWPDQPDTIRTGQYFDIANFAPRIKVPTLVSLGLFDTTCPPTSVAAAYNNLAGPKELLPLHSDHGGPGQRPREVRRKEWLAALVQGKAASLRVSR